MHISREGQRSLYLLRKAEEATQCCSLREDFKPLFLKKTSIAAIKKKNDLIISGWQLRLDCAVLHCDNLAGTLQHRAERYERGEQYDAR